MSEQTSPAPAEQIEDYPHLSITQTNLNHWTVTNRESGTVYKVNLDSPSCTCPDFRVGDSSADGQACKHLLYVGHQSRRDLDPSQWALNRVGREVERIREASQSIEQTATSVEAWQQSGGTQTDTQATQETQEATTMATVEDPEAEVRAWLEDTYAAPEHVDVEAGAHGETEGVRIYPDNNLMSNGQYESFKGLVNSVDGSEVHVGFDSEPCNKCGKQDNEFYYFFPQEAYRKVAE
jgi:hypothetical protein